MRTSLPPDSVVIHFQRGFALAGMTGGTRVRSADTAWAHAGPTAIVGEPAGGMYEARAVAFLQGDSTLFRSYVAITAPRGGWAQPADSGRLGGRRIELCSEIARGAAIASTRPRRDPNAEDSLKVWTRVP
jgi:hypothetical protein